MLCIEENAAGTTTTTTMSATVNNNKKRKTYPTTVKKRESDALRSKSRVNLGQAFSRWRAMKTTLDMRSDEHLGFFLLDSKLPTVLAVLAEKRRAMTRVNIGSAFHRWSTLMEARRMKKHSEVATFLLDWYDQTGPSTSKPSLTSGPLPDRCSNMELIGTVDSHIQGKPQQAVTAGDAHSCTNDLVSSDTVIALKIIGFSDAENVSPDEEKYFPDEEKYSHNEGGGEGTCSNALRVQYQPRSSDEETLSASESLEERFSRMDSIATVDSCIQGKPQQFGSGHPSSDAAITEIIGFSDEESVSSDAENSRPPDEEIDSSDEGGGGGAEGTPDHSSDSDWTPGDETVGSENEEKENDSSVEGGGGKRLGGDEEEEGEHSSDWDGGPLDHRSINSTSVRRERPPQQQTVPWGDTHSFSDSGENFDKGGRKLRKLCPECGMLFRALKPHACEHKIKPCFCNLCGKRFATEQALRIHNKIHQESYKYVCRFCLATFKTRPDKVKHESSHPRRALKPYRCSECPETFVTFLERREHMKRSHRAPRADPVVFVCHTCDMRFRCKHKLQRHSVVHTGEKQYVCKVCERSFNQSGHLRSHMRVHTGEKPYQCQHCDKSFNHNVSLKSHIQRYHDGQAPDPGMEGQTKKTNRKESTAELDDTTEMENSGLNEEEEEAERNNDTLCNSEEKEDEEQGVAKKQNTGKANSGSRRAVNTSHDQLKRKSCDGDEPEEGRGNNSGSASDSADEGEKRRGSKRMRKTSWRSKGRPRRNSEGEEHSSHSEVDLESEENSSDSDFDPTRGKPKKIGKAPQTRKDRRRHRGRSKNNPLV